MKNVIRQGDTLRELTSAGVLLGCLLISGCGQQQAQAKSDSIGGGGVIYAVNHTKWAINEFIVNGVNGVDIVGPYQGGGGACCFSVPGKWKPGMTVNIQWETGLAYSDDFPGYGDDEKYLVWEKKVSAYNRQHRKVVPLPDYNGQKVCGITIHFLPCDEIKVTTSCHAKASPDYPYHYPLRMPEPKTCPKN